MKTTWTKKVKWFKRKPEPVQYDYDWTHTYMNALGNPVECIIIKEKGSYVDILNKNGVTVFDVRLTKLQKITEVDESITE